MNECGWEDEVVVYMGSLDLVPFLVYVLHDFCLLALGRGCIRARKVGVFFLELWRLPKHVWSFVRDG